MEVDPSSKKKKKSKKVEIEIETASPLPVKSPNDEVRIYSPIATPKHHEDELFTLWFQLEGCDPIPILVSSTMSIHQLKLLFGGFTPVAKSSDYESPHFQSELLGLRGIRPQQIKLASQGKALSPHSQIGSSLQPDSIVQIQVVPSPITAELTGNKHQSNSNIQQSLMEQETALMMFKMKSEIDDLRRKQLRSSNSVAKPSNATDATAQLETSDDGEIEAPLAGRLAILEAKLDAKNAQLDALIKDMKILTLAFRGATHPNPDPNQNEGVSNIKCKQTIEGHAGPVWGLTKNNNFVFSGSSDSTVQAWDSQTLRPVRTMNGHTGIVHCVEVYGSTVISGSDDRCIKFWDMDQDFKCTKTVMVNNIACVLRAASNHLFAGLHKTVKVWNLETGEPSGDLENHNHWVRALNVTKGHLFSGCYNVINMIDLGTFKHMKSMTQNIGSIYSIVVDNSILYAGTYSNVISIWDLRTFECVRTLTGHTGAVYSLAMSKATGKLYSGSYDTTIRVWDLNSLSPIQKLVGHTSSVESLLSTDAGLMSASTDGTIKLWK